MTDSFGLSVSTLPYGVVGTAIVWQRPRTRIGWVLVAFASLWAATFLGIELAASTAQPGLVVAAAWLAEWTWLPALVSVFVILPILFPTGTPLGRGWALALWLAIAVCVGFVFLTTFQAEFNPSTTMAVPNPWAIFPMSDVEAFLVPGIIPVLLLGPAAAVVRFRQARGVERQQIRWFMYAGVACGVLFAVNAALDATNAGPSEISELLVAIGLSLPPIGIWVAITRYHLYDINRLISRTLSYGLLTALLVGLYVVSIFVLGAVIPLEGQLPVAGATLLVAAVFNPLRRRIQEAVDRRFNRARYDARRLVESFSHRIRVEQDFEAIRAELQTTVEFTMQPGSYSLWLPDPEPPPTSAEVDTIPRA